MIYSSIQSLCEAKQLNPALIRLAKQQGISGFNKDGTIDWRVLKDNMLSHQEELEELLPEFNTRNINQLIQIDRKIKKRIKHRKKDNLLKFSRYKPTLNLIEP